jgi:GAF domain-containing protein
MSCKNTETYTDLISQVEQIIEAETVPEVKLREVCRLLADEVDVFDWVGFYLVDPDADRELVLGPYVGEPTDHTRIPFGKGICGQAAEMLETFVVQDVSKASNYLSCSIHVKAEIVVPVMKDDTFVAELDIDSHTKNSITEDHRRMLEEICRRVAKIL